MGFYIYYRLTIHKKKFKKLNERPMNAFIFWKNVNVNAFVRKKHERERIHFLSERAEHWASRKVHESASKYRLLNTTYYIMSTNYFIISCPSSTRQRRPRITRSLFCDNSAHHIIIIITAVQRILLLRARVYRIHIIILSCRDRTRRGRRRVSGLRFSCTGVLVYTSISRSGRRTKDLVYMCCVTTTTSV
jgi:hypothetical protein